MRREPDLFHGCGQPLAEQAPAADCSGELRNPRPVLRSLRRQPARNHKQHRFRGAQRRPGSAVWIGRHQRAVLYRMGLSGPFDFEQPWRFITAIFLHGSLLHIGFNMWVLMDLGPTIEEMYGSARFLFVFIATGVSGYVLSAVTGHSKRRRLGFAAWPDRPACWRSPWEARTSACACCGANYSTGLSISRCWGCSCLESITTRTSAGSSPGSYSARSCRIASLPTRSARRRAWALGWTAGLAVVASFAFMLFNYFHSAIGLG